jgi:teichuronic acid biosynthesis glycosyltransferase TuaH
LDHRFGFDVIETAASENSNLNFELIGPITAAARARLSHLKNVRLVGAIAFDELPRHLARASIGLLPLSQHASNEGRSPMKLFEYAAMGLPVVATHTSELARRNLGFVSLAATPGAFSSCLAEWKSGTLSFGDCRAEAAKHGWAEKAQQALQFAMGN